MTSCHRRALLLFACLAAMSPGHAEDQEMQEMLPPLLQGFAEQAASGANSPTKLLFGGVDQRFSSLTAIQRKGSSSRLHAELFGMTPMFAPQSQRGLSGQVTHSRPLLFDLLADKKRPLVGQVSLERPQDDPILLRGRPRFDNSVDAERPIPIVDVALPRGDTEPQLEARRPHTDATVDSQMPVLDVGQPSRPKFEGTLQNPVADADVVRSPRPGTDTLSVDRPTDEDMQRGHHRKRRVIDTDLTIVRTNPGSESITGSSGGSNGGAGGGTGIGIGYRSGSGFDEIGRVKRRPTTDVTYKRSRVIIDEDVQTRPNANQPLPLRARPDDTLIASRPGGEPSADVVRKPPPIATDIVRPRPNFEVIYRRPDEPAVNSQLETNANLLKRRNAPPLEAADQAVAGRLNPSSNHTLADQNTNALLLPRAERPFSLAAHPGKLDRKQADNRIVWDRWYAEVSRMCEPLLADAVEKRGNPAGSNSIQITVWRDHQLSAKVVGGSHNEFDAAMVEAYNSLNGNAALEFPVGSRRDKVTFFVDNKHDSADPVSGVDSRSIVGDQEGP